MDSTFKMAFCNPVHPASRQCDQLAPLPASSSINSLVDLESVVVYKKSVEHKTLCHTSVTCGRLLASSRLTLKCNGLRLDSDASYDSYALCEAISHWDAPVGTKLLSNLSSTGQIPERKPYCPASKKTVSFKLKRVAIAARLVWANFCERLELIKI